MGIASATGKILVGPVNSPEFSISVDFKTGTINENIKGRKIVPQNTTNQGISVENIASIKFVWLNGIDSNGDPRYFVPRLNGTMTFPQCTSFLYCSYNGTTCVTAIAITTQATGGDTIIEYALAGD